MRIGVQGMEMELQIVLIFEERKEHASTSSVERLSTAFELY